MTKILFVASEAVPYIKTGGLADVVGSLPKYFDKEKYDVRVILPKYACMDELLLAQLKFVCHFYVNLNWRKQYVGIFTTEYKGVRYYFVDNEFYFAGDKPYNNIYEDVEKFAYFSKAVLESLPYIDFAPDILHCHDWQTGLVPVYLRTTYGSDSFYAGINTIFTIHNMKFQGRWKIREVMDITGLPEHIFRTASGLESYGESNYLKGGIVYADAVSTVSPEYAKEITTREGGEGLDGLMNARIDSLYGIVNGIDYEEFNPETDPHIETNYTVKNAVAGKRKNKLALQKMLGLPVRDDVFMIGIISRMTSQKGFDLIAYILDEIFDTMDVQFVVLGTGEGQYENMFHHFHNKYPDKLWAHIGYSDEYAHKIYASCDAFLMPSLFEPCGLGQMMAMRYGTLPIVRETGGLKDTVEAYNEYENTGTGFSFSNYNAHEMLFILRYAQNIYKENRSRWNEIVQRAMQKDFSWGASAKSYETLYDKVTEDIK
ncbi:MAG: glycogen synthase GlgA [Lachnospiraceae bacterium]|nr:glycogen synthase GlgA [Lachnospiraceae bacterium]MDY5521798.1 glycogen synthase GlgA [Agathobacter sp.]